MVEDEEVVVVVGRGSGGSSNDVFSRAMPMCGLLVRSVFSGS